MNDQIIRIRFANYKSFNDAAFVDMDLTKPVCLIIGKNNSGKSSILDIIERIYCNRPKDFGNPVEEGCKLRIGRKSKVIRVDCNVDVNSCALKDPDIEWYQANIPERNPLDNAMNDFYGDWVPIDNDRTCKLLSHNAKTDEFISIANILSKTKFARINADRDIVPEKADDLFILNKNGSGATNLIRHFI